MDRNALDWIFSTFPQALAALSGLVFTGVSFFIDHLEKKALVDDSLAEIMDKMKKRIHKSLSILFWLCCVIIAMDIVAIFINPIRDGRVFSFCGEWDWYYFITILLFVANVLALILVIRFVLSIVNPTYMEKTIESLKKDYQIQKIAGSEYVDGIEFFRLFQEFEKGVRSKVDKETKEYAKDSKMTIFQIIDFLHKHGIIDYPTYKNLRHINSLRNILTHGSIDEKVPKNDYDMLQSYCDKIKEWPRINW